MTRDKGRTVSTGHGTGPVHTPRLHIKPKARAARGDVLPDVRA